MKIKFETESGNAVIIEAPGKRKANQMMKKYFPHITVKSKKVMKKFRMGQRVVPKSWKTGDHGATLDKSKEWNDAQEKKQPFLWVQVVEDDFHILCSAEKKSKLGDYFYVSDLEPFKKTK